jgi:2-keto-3-deoxy-L-rhamnonate aldolase RhmA
VETGFSLYVFSVEPEVVRCVTAAGVTGVIVDCEVRGKAARQAGYDTQINRNAIEAVRQVREATEKTIICRINGSGPTTNAEIEQAIDCGTDEILLPMVRSVQEVEAALNRANGRCGVGVMVENMAAARMVNDLAELPLSRAYIGLNDLSIDRKAPNIFTALTDGTVECIRRAFSCPVGFAALTLPEKGHPIPCRLLMGELARLRCDFSILRRAFFADTIERDMGKTIPLIYAGMRYAFHRPPLEVAQDRVALQEAIDNWPVARLAA